MARCPAGWVIGHACQTRCPVIGRSPKVKNVTFAFGHGHIGLITAASTGKLVSEIVTGNTPGIDPTPYRIDRF